MSYDFLVRIQMHGLKFFLFPSIVRTIQKVEYKL